MSDPSPRAHITSRARAADSWDAGLHAESDVGPIDVGLSVEPTALGLVLDAPHVGQVRLALDVDAQGVTRLSALSRRLDDGTPGVLQVADATTSRELARLRARVQELEDRSGLLESERDEARARAALVMEERRELERRVLELKANLSARREAVQQSLQETTAQLEIEKSGRLEALAERERLRDELEALRAQLADAETGYATTRAEADEARARVEQLDRELEDVRTARAALEEQLLASQVEAEQAAGALEARVKELEQALADSQRRGDERAEASRTELETARARVTELEQALAEATATASRVAALEQTAAEGAAHVERLAALEAALAEAQGQAARVSELEASLAEAQGRAARVSELEASLAEAQGRAARVAELEAALTDAQTRVAELEQALAEAQRAAGEREAKLEEALLAARQSAKAGGSDALVAQLQAELTVATQQLHESHEVVQAWEAALSTEQAATAEARTIARQLKEQVDRLTAERDEARAIARQLHQRLAGKGEPATKEQLAKLTQERDRLALQVDSLGRQLEGERTARARAVAERDALREKLGDAGIRTETDIPVVSPPDDPTTEPHNAVPSAKKKP
ncbi:MAG: hypothetical protein AB1730_24420 [Myxococcota bacterium]|jgi:chromosome segregation ATPase